MSYYAVVFVTPKSEAWIPDYRGAVGPLVAKHGGKYLARTTSHARLEGTDPSPDSSFSLNGLPRNRPKPFIGTQPISLICRPDWQEPRVTSSWLKERMTSLRRSAWCSVLDEVIELTVQVLPEQRWR